MLKTEIDNYGNLQKFFGQFLGYLHPKSHPRSLTTRKIKTLKKPKNYPEMSSFYTCVQKTTILWCMLPHIWSETDIIFCHFGHFLLLKWKLGKNVEKTWRYYPLHICTITEVHIMCVSWDIKAWLTQLFVVSCHFLYFDPPNNLKNQNFEKNRKRSWRYYHFTLVYHKWQSDDVWFMRYEAGQTDFFVILNSFLHFYLLQPGKSKCLKYENMVKDIIVIHTSVL